MTDRRRRVFFWMIAGALASQINPALQAAGADGASFLNIPVGGRPAALGGAYSALAADAYAPVWNPAGLAALPAAQLAGMHLDYADSIGYEFVSFTQPLGGRHGIGLAASYLHPKSAVERDASGAETGRFSSHYAAYSLAYGRGLSDSFALGVAAKAVEARLGGVSGQAFGADIGALYRATPRVSVAAVAANLGSKLKFLDERDRLPGTYRLGLLFSPTRAWNLAGEAALDREDAAFGRLGAEWLPMPAISLRTGYHTDSTRDLPGLTGFTAGLGLTVFGQRFDYAWAPMGDLGQTQYFSVVFSFGAGAAHE